MFRGYDVTWLMIGGYLVVQSTWWLPVAVEMNLLP